MCARCVLGTRLSLEVQRRGLELSELYTPVENGRPGESDQSCSAVAGVCQESLWRNKPLADPSVLNKQI